MTSVPIGSRRGFIAGLGMASVAGLARATEEGKPGVSDYLLPAGTIHLNTASLGATPRVVLDRTLQAWRDLESSPELMAYGKGANTVLSAAEQVRERAAVFLGCKPRALQVLRSEIA